MSGKKELDQEIPLPPEIGEWRKCAEMRYDNQTSKDQQAIEQTPVHSEKGNIEDDNTPVESQIVGYNAAQDQHALQSAGEIKYVDSSELFQMVAEGTESLLCSSNTTVC